MNNDIRNRMGDPSGVVNKNDIPKMDKPKQGMPMGPGRGGPRHGMPGEKPKNIKATVGKLLKYIGKSKYQLIGLIIIMLITTGLSLVGPALQGTAINVIYDIVDHKDGAFDRLITILITMAVVYIFSSLFTWIQGVLSAKVSQSTVYTLRKDLFNKLILVYVCQSKRLFACEEAGQNIGGV